MSGTEIAYAPTRGCPGLRRSRLVARAGQSAVLESGVRCAEGRRYALCGTEVGYAVGGKEVTGSSPHTDWGWITIILQ
eukprot:1710169-Rhodomonas_salina.4